MINEVELQFPPAFNPDISTITDTDTALPSLSFPIIVIPFEELKQCQELPRLGITQEQRKQKGLKHLEILPPHERQSVVQPWQQLAIHLIKQNKFIPAKDFLVDIADVDSTKSFNVFISHRWIRGWDGAPGYDKRAHTDDRHKNKYKLIIEGVEKFWKAAAPGMTECHVWLDFSCINQDGDPTGELKDLDNIVGWADAMFTPIYQVYHTIQRP
jgi:hypothetical protein